ncbi:hypothetical protein NAI52_10230 [Francisella tularensis subsp. holarctica]|nr:hypothetical protein [Francisella tularensis subsp. holarctica]
MFDRSLTISDKVFINRVNMHEQKLDYSFGYDDKTFKDWDENGHIL